MAETKQNKIWIYSFWAIFALAVSAGIVYYAWNRTDAPKTDTTATVTGNCDIVSTKLTKTDELNANEVKITACNFDKEVLKAEGLVVVDAYASWCPHCQKIAPIIATLADEYAGKVKIGKMNANNQDDAMKANFDYAVKNGLEGYPTVWFYKNGKIVDSFSGERTYDEIKALLDKQL